MKKVTPYKTKLNALKALDNGGRLFNLLTHADDGRIDAVELKRAAGAFSSRQKMVLYLEMALAGLEPGRAKEVRSRLSAKLKRAHEKYTPRSLSRENASPEPSQSLILSGVVTPTTSKTQVTGYVPVPISTGNTTTVMMFPVVEVYQLYEVRESKSAPGFLVACTKKARDLSGQRIRFGGIVRELNSESGKPRKGKVYLEALFYSPI